MTERQKVLVESYLEMVEAEKRAHASVVGILKSLETLAPHKVGEVVKWVEKGRKKRTGGSWMNPQYVDLPDKVHFAVLTKIKPWICSYMNNELRYDYEFQSIKSDGDISRNHAYPLDGYEWTGDIHYKYREEENI